MLTWLRQKVSKWLQLEVCPGDIATLQQVVGALVEDVTVLKTSMARTERKVYRDKNKENGGGDVEAVEAALHPKPAFSFDILSPGDQVPPDILV